MVKTPKVHKSKYMRYNLPTKQTKHTTKNKKAFSVQTRSKVKTKTAKNDLWSTFWCLVYEIKLKCLITTQNIYLNLFYIYIYKKILNDLFLKLNT